MRAWDNAELYFERALGTANFAWLGAVLFAATLVLAIVAASTEDGHRKDWYIAVAVTTAATGVSTGIDFGYNARWITPCTVALGSFALLVSQSLWSEDKSDALATILFVVQLLAVGVQIGAISNSPGRGTLIGG